MLASLIRYLRQHHLGLIAVFIAATGTAYAGAVPRNSVGTKQVRNGSLLGKDFKEGVLPRSLSGVEGPRGPEGPEGPAGPEGPQGPRGPSGSMGDAGGDLAGTYPNPRSANDAASPSDLFDGAL